MQSFIGMVGIYNKSLSFLLSRPLQVDWRDMSLGGSVHTRHSEKVAYGSKMLVDTEHCQCIIWM